MEYRRLGATDLQVSRICFGTFPLSGAWGAFDQDEAIATTRRAFESGINFFDTAQAYGFGLAEGLISQALGPEIKLHRSDLVLATKGGLRMENGRPTRDSSPAWLRQGLEESLNYLGTDYVDLYQIHWPDSATPIEETAATAEDFVREGKVRYVGVSNYDVAQMEAFGKTRKVDTLQPPYSLFVRQIEDAILPYCQAERIGVLIYGPLAHGLLGGGCGPEAVFPEDDWRCNNPAFQGQGLRRNLRVVEKLKQYAALRGRSVAQLAVAWTLANPAVDVAIVGARRSEQIAETAFAAEFHLTKTEREEVEAIAREAALEEPTPETV